MDIPTLAVEASDPSTIVSGKFWTLIIPMVKTPEGVVLWVVGNEQWTALIDANGEFKLLPPQSVDFSWLSWRLVGAENGNHSG